MASIQLWWMTSEEELVQCSWILQTELREKTVHRQHCTMEDEVQIAEVMHEIKQKLKCHEMFFSLDVNGAATMAADLPKSFQTKM